jgi:hypothetical protein
MPCDCNLTDKRDYSVDKESEVPMELRADTYDETIQATSKNGGLYGGVAADRSWIPKPVYPTSAYFTNYLLKSANPPPGAMEQAIGTNRPGNNYIPMPHVKWYAKTPVTNQGPFDLKVIHKCH